VVGALDTESERLDGARQARAAQPLPCARNALDTGGHSHRWNAYAYVGDTPLEATDPLGLSGNGDCGAAPGTQPSATVIYTCDEGGIVYGWQNVNVASALPPGLPLAPPSAIGGMIAGVGEGLGFFTNQLVFFTAVGIPGDLGLIGCLGTGEFAPACMEGVELALGGPSILGTFAFVHQYNTAVDAAKSQLQACQGRL
jgi:hypothetical protein